MIQQATHIYSGATGSIVGYNSEYKAHIIKLGAGNEQYWRDGSFTCEGELDMEKEISIELNKKGAHIITRYFTTIKEASEYLTELKILNNIHSFTNKGKNAEISSEWSIISNYDLRKLIDKTKKPMPLDLDKKLNSVIRVSSSMTKKRTKKTTLSSDMVKLQDLTNDTRKARVILRKLVRDKVITKPGRWEWLSNSPELDIVKKALK